MKTRSANSEKSFIRKGIVIMLGIMLFGSSGLMANSSYKMGEPKINKMANTAKSKLEKPHFPLNLKGLYKHLENNLEYPEFCAKNKLQGKTYVQFSLDKDGTIINPEIVKSSHELFDKEAIRVLNSSPKIIVIDSLAKDGKTKYTIPVSFVIE